MPYLCSPRHRFRIFCRLHPVDLDNTHALTNTFKEYARHCEQNKITTEIEVHEEFTYSVNLYQIFVALGPSLDKVKVTFWVNNSCIERSEYTLYDIEAQGYLIISSSISLKDTLEDQGQLRLQLRPVCNSYSIARTLPPCFDSLFDFSKKQSAILHHFRPDFTDRVDAQLAEYPDCTPQQQISMTGEADERRSASPTSTSRMQNLDSRDRETVRSDRRRGFSPHSRESSRGHSQMQEENGETNPLYIGKHDLVRSSVTNKLNSTEVEDTKVDASKGSKGEEDCNRCETPPRPSKDDEEVSTGLSADTLADDLPLEGMSEYGRRAQEARKARALVEAEIEAFEKQEAEEEEAKLREAEKRLSYLKRKRALHS